MIDLPQQLISFTQLENEKDSYATGGNIYKLSSHFWALETKINTL